MRLKGLEKPVEVVAVRPEHEDVARDLAFRRALDPAARRRARDAQPVQGAAGVRRGRRRRLLRPGGADGASRRASRGRRASSPSSARAAAASRRSCAPGLVPGLRQGALPGSERWYIVEMFPGAYPLEELEAALLRARGTAAGRPARAARAGRARPAARGQAAPRRRRVGARARRRPARGGVHARRGRGSAHAVPGACSSGRSPIRTRGCASSSRCAPTSTTGRSSTAASRSCCATTSRRSSRCGRRSSSARSPARRSGSARGSSRVCSRELVADVSDEPGALPLLQYALTELYERREGSMLTRDAYRAIGGVSGALAGRAEEIYAGLGEDAQEAARQLFLRLVTLGEGAEDTRRRVERTELASMEVDQAALEEAIQEFGAGACSRSTATRAAGRRRSRSRTRRSCASGAASGAGSTAAASRCGCIGGSPPRRASGRRPAASRATSCAAATSRSSSCWRASRRSRSPSSSASSSTRAARRTSSSSRASGARTGG